MSEMRRWAKDCWNRIYIYIYILLCCHSQVIMPATEEVDQAHVHVGMYMMS